MRLYRVQFRLYKGVNECRIFEHEAIESEKCYNIRYQAKRILKNKIGVITDDVVVNSANVFYKTCWLLDELLINETLNTMKEQAVRFYDDLERKLEGMRLDITRATQIVRKKEYE